MIDSETNSQRERERERERERDHRVELVLYLARNLSPRSYLPRERTVFSVQIFSSTLLFQTSFGQLSWETCLIGTLKT